MCTRVRGEVEYLLSHTIADRLMEVADVTALHLHWGEDVVTYSCGFLDPFGEGQFYLVGLLSCPSHRVVGCLEHFISAELLKERVDDVRTGGIHGVLLRNPRAHV